MFSSAIIIVHNAIWRLWNGLKPVFSVISYNYNNLSLPYTWISWTSYCPLTSAAKPSIVHQHSLRSFRFLSFSLSLSQSINFTWTTNLCILIHSQAMLSAALCLLHRPIIIIQRHGFGFRFYCNKKAKTAQRLWALVYCSRNNLMTMWNLPSNHSQCQKCLLQRFPYVPQLCDYFHKTIFAARRQQNRWQFFTALLEKK